MEGDGIEEGLESATSPLLLGDKSTGSTTTSNQHSITPVLVFSTFVALCGSFSYGCSVGYSSPAESGIMKDLGLSVAAYSVFGSIVTVGGMVGAILSGKMADLIGRRGTMWTCQIICMAGWLAIAFAKKAWCLDIGRFLVGVAIGILTYVVVGLFPELKHTQFTWFGNLPTPRSYWFVLMKLYKQYKQQYKEEEKIFSTQLNSP